MSGSFGGSQSSSSSSQFLSPLQAPFLQQLFQGAQQVQQQQQPQISGVAQGLAGQLGQQGQGFLDTLGGNQFTEQLGQFAQQGNPFVQQQISNFGQDIGQNLGQNILPQIRSGGIATGQPGGSRAGIAEGLALQGAQRAFGQGVTDLRSNAFNQQVGAAQAGGQLAQGGAAAGLGGIGELFNLGLGGFQAEFAPLQNLAAILGSPILEGKSKGKSSSLSLGF